MKHFYLSLLLALLFVSCKKEQTVWESDWNAPLINDTLSLADLVNDSTLNVSSGYYALDLERTLFDLSISDIVSIPDTTIERDYVSQINLEVQPNTTFAGSVETYSLDMDDLQLKLVTLKSGSVEVHVENPLETIAYFLVKLPKVSKNGVTFQHVLAAPPASGNNPGILEETIDLSGYTMDLTGETGGSYNEILADYSVTTDPSGSPAWIYTSDVTRVRATFHDATVSYAQGYFGSREITDTTEIDLTALDVYESGALDIDNLSLSFDIRNGVKVGAVASILMVKNENVNGSVVALTGSNIGSAITVNPATGNWGTLTPSLTTLTFNSMNSNINGYVENLGTKHEVGYSFKLNPWGNVSGGWDQVFPNSRIQVGLRASMPLSIGLDNLVVRDTFDLTLNQDPDKTRIVSGDLILSARNGFPFSAEVTIELLDANGNVVETITGSEPITSSQYGTLDSNTGIMVSDSKVVFSLDKETVTAANEVTKAVVRAKFNSPDPSANNTSQPMLVPEKAFLGVKLKAAFKTENKL